MVVFFLILEMIIIFAGYKGRWLLFFLFAIPVLWISWIVSVVVATKNKIWFLSLLWLLIDFAILGIAMITGQGNHADSDYFYAIVFFPLLIPAMLAAAISPVFGKWLSGICNAAANILIPHPTNSVLSEWIGFSLISAVTSIIIVALCVWRHTQKLDNSTVK